MQQINDRIVELSREDHAGTWHRCNGPFMSKELMMLRILELVPNSIGVELVRQIGISELTKFPDADKILGPT